MPSKKYRVTLTAEERAELQALLAGGRVAARKQTHARLLLKADEAPGGPGWSDAQITAALDVSRPTVERVRQRFVEAGLAAALDPRPPVTPRRGKLDGAAEARLITLACSIPPAGQARWTLRLLADRFVLLTEAGATVPVSHELVRRTLKKTF